MSSHKEKILINDVKKTLDDAVGYDARGAGGYDRVNDRQIPDTSTYISGDSLPAFQKLATRIAALIDEQGPENTDPRLTCIAKNLAKLSEREYDHASSVGFAFKRGFEGGETPKNPFFDHPKFKR